MKVIVRNFKFSKDDYRPEDMHNTVMEIWGGEFNINSAFTIQVDRNKSQYRYSPKDGTSQSYSKLFPIEEIEDILSGGITEFEWDFNK